MARKTVRSRRLGSQIRKLRMHANMSQERLSELINADQPTRACISQGQLSKVEAGTALIDVDQLARVVVAVGADSETGRELEGLRARAEEPGWWAEYSPYIHETLEMVVELGEAARSMRTYDAVFVQGLVQTEDYTRVVIESAKAFVRPIDVEALVELRMRRQARLLDPQFGQLTVVLTEATLRHQVGSPVIQRAQLEKLLAVAEEGTAAIHVLRHDQGPWPGVGSFAIFDFPDADDADVAYVDGDLGASIYEDRERVAALTYTFSAALDRALSSRESLDLCRSVIKEL